jgi:hypothetical protein
VLSVMHTGFAMKVVNVGFLHMLTQVYAQPLTAAIPAGAAAFVLVRYGGIDGLIAKACVVAITLSIFITAMFLLFATLAERREAKEIAQTLLSRLGTIARTG